MGFTLAFALGMLGSLHCVAMCGPLMAAMPAPSDGAARFVTGRLLYQLGRIATYALLGVFAGMVGRSLYLIGLQRWLSIGMGLALLAGFIVSKRISISSPVARWVVWLKTAMSGQLQQKGFRSQFLLGMLNGVLPCGLVYVAMAGATTAGGICSGVAYMAVFGLGTLPAMLSITLWGRLLPAPLRWRLRRMIPIGICGLAALLILRGMALGIPYLSPDLAGSTPACCAR